MTVHSDLDLWPCYPVLLQAVNYYEAALKNSMESQPHLRMELAELYLKLKQFEKADRTVRTGLSESREEGESLTHLMDATRYWQLLARVYREGGSEVVKVITALENARDNQARCAGSELCQTLSSAFTLARKL